MKNTSQLFPSVVEILKLTADLGGRDSGRSYQGLSLRNDNCVVEDLASNASHSIAAIDDFDNLPAVTRETITSLATCEPKCCLMMCSSVQLL